MPNPSFITIAYTILVFSKVALRTKILINLGFILGKVFLIILTNSLRSFLVLEMQALQVKFTNSHLWHEKSIFSILSLVNDSKGQVVDLSSFCLFDTVTYETQEGVVLTLY